MEPKPWRPLALLSGPTVVPRDPISRKFRQGRHKVPSPIVRPITEADQAPSARHRAVALSAFAVLQIIRNLQIRIKYLALKYLTIYYPNVLSEMGVQSMTVYGYARLSTDGQSVAAQEAQLLAAGCAKVYSEKISGKATDGERLVAWCRRPDTDLSPWPHGGQVLKMELFWARS